MPIIIQGWIVDCDCCQNIGETQCAGYETRRRKMAFIEGSRLVTLFDGCPSCDWLDLTKTSGEDVEVEVFLHQKIPICWSLYDCCHNVRCSMLKLSNRDFFFNFQLWKELNICKCFSFHLVAFVRKFLKFFNWSSYTCYYSTFSAFPFEIIQYFQNTRCSKLI